MNPIAAPLAFLAASCIACACAPTSVAAARFVSVYAALRCICLSISSSASSALIEDTPNDTISIPRFSLHLLLSSSLRAAANSVVCAGI